MARIERIKNKNLWPRTLYPFHPRHPRSKTSPAFDKLRPRMHAACMATKTISIDLVAYEALTKARKSPGESFSQVIRRASWDTRSPATGSELLEMLKDSPSGPPDLVEALNANQALDTPPRDPWDE